MPCNLLETLTVLMSWLGEGEGVEEGVVEEKQRLSVLRIFIPCKLLETLTVLISRQVEGEGVEKGMVEAELFRIYCFCQKALNFNVVGKSQTITTKKGNGIDEEGAHFFLPQIHSR